ncbi:MAG TPA: polyprenol monophosphomannose synthase [bacterium]|nr:polyprenol monophosphomannose synthase [bacterium]
MPTWVIIPTYNEAENLPRLVEAIFDLKINGLSVVVVDDNSPDGTGSLADQLSALYPLHVIHRAGKLGLGSAYREGFRYCLSAGAKCLIEMDADFSHNPGDLPRLISAVEAGADLAMGSRKVAGGQIIGWNWRRKLYSDGAMFFARLVLGLKTHDITAGFRCFRSSALESVDYARLKSNGYAFQIEMIYRLEKAGLKIVEIPVTFPDRRIGTSKLGRKDILEFFKLVFKLKFS